MSLSDISSSIRRHGSFRKMPRKKRMILVASALIIFAVIDVLLFIYTTDRMQGYELINTNAYVEFDMPKKAEISESSWEKIVNSATVKKYPENQLETEKQNIRNQYLSRMKEYGMSYTEYLKSSGLTRKEFEASIEELAKNNVKEKIILYAIARKYGVSVSDAEIEQAEKAEMKARGASTEAEYKKITGETLAEHSRETDVESKVLYKKIVSQ
jgi:FKBP-type peptidyl-prolyl cis-trans isomerase (trigger factor)